MRFGEAACSVQGSSAGVLSCWPPTVKGVPVYRKPPQHLPGLPYVPLGSCSSCRVKKLWFSVSSMKSPVQPPHPKLSPQSREDFADGSLGLESEHFLLSGVVVLTLVRQIFTQPLPHSLAEATCLLFAFSGSVRSHLHLQPFLKFYLSLYC